MIRETQTRWWQRLSYSRRVKRPSARRRHPFTFPERLRIEELEARQLLSSNNPFPQALPLTLGQSQSGNTSQTPTVYSFAVTSSGRLTAQVTPTGGATRLTLLSSSGQTLMQSDGQSATNPTDLLDLHVDGSATGTTYYLEVQGLGAGAGTYQLQTTFVAATAPFQPLSVPVAAFARGHAVDLNHDGIQDLVVANYFTENVSVMLGRGDGTFAPATNYLVNGLPTDVVAVDLTGHGVLDLVTSNILGTLTILPGNGNGTFGTPIQTAVGLNPSAIVAGDFNADGHMDLAVGDVGWGKVVVLLGNGDRTFAAPSYYTAGAVGSGPGAMIEADFNHDGRLDLATANPNANTVSVLLGNADGTFQAARNYAVGQAPHALVAGDFTGNGRLDIATANTTSNDVSVLLNRGDGTFSAATTLAAGTGPSGIVAADFNGSGHLDLATSNQNDGTLSVFLGHGDGTFDTQSKLVVGSAPGFAVATDFNHDGRVDLAHGNVTGQVYVDIGRGDGTFQTLAPTATVAGPNAVATGHFTGDGHLDLAISDNTTGDVDILLGRGDGTFQFGGRYAAGSGPQSILTADFNRDGKLDLAVTNTFANTVTILFGDGDGTFGHATALATGHGPYDAVAGDFDGDGKLDLAVADSGSNAVSILRGHGDGTFSTHVDYAVGTTPLAIVAGDFTGNGILDLATANIASNNVSVLYGRGDGTFGNTVQLAAGYGPYAIVAGDLNGDGRLDLAAANIYSGNVSLFLGQNGGTFARAVALAVGPFPAHLVVADFNHDGHLDLAASLLGTSSVNVLLGQGNGTFQAQAPIHVGSGPNGLAAADFNGDGLPDLAAVNFTSSDVSVALNRGSGAFQNAMQVAIGGGPTSMAGADFNDDGSFDVVTANPTAGNVQIVLGNGGGTFRTPSTIPLQGEPYAVFTGDFNHDGRADIAVANYLTNTVSILLGVGDGTFGAPLTFAVGSHPDAIVAGDFNGDGILDLAVANYGSGTVSILQGQGDGSFGVVQQIAVGQGPIALAKGDLDNDGTIDLVVANSMSHNVAILKGLGNGRFQVARLVPLGSNPSAVVVGDVNRDGNLDIATANQADNSVFVMQGNGDGTFQAPVRYATGNAPVSLVISDFDEDGQIELAVAASGSNEVDLLLPTNSGGFSAGPRFGVGSYPNALLFADLNNDGHPDVVTANGMGQPLSVGLGLNNGTFADPDVGSHSIRSTPLVGDLNGDGLPDVAILAGDGRILVRFADPSHPGVFLPPVVLNSSAANRVSDLTLVDVHGKAELAALDAGTGRMSFYTYAGNSSFVHTPGPVVCSSGLMVRIVAGDVNGDGLQDLVVASTGASNSWIKVFIQQPDGSFGPVSYDIPVGASVSDVALVRLSGGPGPDIVLTDSFSGTVRVLLNTVTNPFATQRIFRAGTGLYEVAQTKSSTALESRENPVSFVAGSFAGSAATDLIVLNSGSDQFDLLVGNGRGGLFNPTTSLNYRTGWDATAIVSADFNRDGIDDLAVLDRSSGQVLIYLGDGQGGFRPAYELGGDGRPQGYGAGNAPDSLMAADLDGTGILDLLVGNSQGDVLILQGNGNGTFAPYHRVDRHVALAVTSEGYDGEAGIALANQASDSISYYGLQDGVSFQQDRQNGVLSPRAVLFADLNADGIPDLIVANGGGNDIFVYLGLGDGKFGPATSFSVGTDPVSVTVADLTGTGTPDLIVANEGSNDISILYGHGRGAQWTLLRGPRLDAGFGPDATAVQDVDGDGVLEIFVANSGSNNVYMLHGTGRGFYDDANPEIFQTGVDPTQLFLGHFHNATDWDLVTVNAGSNDLTFFPSLGSGRSISAGGVEPVAAVVGDFNSDGMSELLVAHANGHFALLMPGSDGLTVTTVFVRPELTNVSDMVLGGIDGNTVEVFASSTDQNAAIPLSFVIEATTAPTSSTTISSAPGRVVSEFSSVSGSALEVVATLTIASSSDAFPVSQVTTRESGQEIPWVFDTNSPSGPAALPADSGQGEDGVQEQAVIRADVTEATVERNAMVTGVIETPIEQYLDSTGDVVSKVPFVSPLELFNSASTVPVRGRWEQIIDEVSRWLHAADAANGQSNHEKPRAPTAEQASGASIEPETSAEPDAIDGVDCGVTIQEETLQGQLGRTETDSGEEDHWEYLVESYRPSLNPEQVLALALGVVAPFLVRELPAAERGKKGTTSSRRGS